MEIQHKGLKHDFNVWNMRQQDDSDPVGFYGKPNIEQYPYYEEFFDTLGIRMFILPGPNKTFISWVVDVAENEVKEYSHPTRAVAKLQNVRHAEYLLTTHGAGRKDPLTFKEIERLLIDMEFDVVKADPKEVVFLYKGNNITFYIKKQWASGKGIKDGRGFDYLLKQLK